MERRPSHDDRTPSPDSARTNVFDDEFEVDTPVNDEDLVVADGFRPEGSRNASHVDFSNNDQVFPKHSAEAEPDYFSPAEINPTKVQKGGNYSRIDDGFVNQAGGSDSHQSAYAAQALMHRASVGSTASFVTSARSSTPMGGPSHPYTMYPQGTVPARNSMSSPTIRAPQRSYSGQRPTHPYALYTQNVVEDEEANLPQQTIPLGFPGHDTGYHRRIGPDGEEQDIVGPDGHTEQLPPYTRYAEEAPKPFAAVSPVSTSSPVEPPPLPQVSNESADAILPIIERSGVSQMTSNTDRSSSSSVSDKAKPAGEKEWSEKSWQEKRRTRVCGRVPLWLIFLLVVLFLMFAIVLGASVGATRKHAKDNASKETVTVTMFDASLIPTPTDLPPLPTGTFGIEIDVPEERKFGCLSQTGEYNAWSCNMPQFAPPLQLAIQRSPVANGVHDQAWLKPPNQEEFPVMRYGVQAPTINMTTVDLVADHDAISFGPAWHFQALYHKVVILQEDKFPAGRIPQRRRSAPSSIYDFKHRDEVQPYQRPWFCHWEGTFIEVYVYASKVAESYITAPPPGYTELSTPTQTPSLSSSPSTPSSPPSQTAGVKRDIPLAVATPALDINARYSDGNDLPWFPRSVKIEERRVKDSPQPYCQQMQILEDGKIAPAVYPDTDQHIIVALHEDEPPEEYPDRKRSLEGRNEPNEVCHCQWEYN